MTGGFKESVIIPLDTLKTLEEKASLKVPNYKIENIGETDEVQKAIKNELPINVSDNVKKKMENRNSKEILTSSEIPDNVKLKMFNHARWKEKNKAVSTPNFMKKDMEHIVKRMQLNDQPFVRSIMDNYISKNLDDVSWMHDFEIKLGKKIFPDSNIIKSLQYLMTNAPSKYSPKGTKELAKKLLEIGVPSGWIKHSDSIAASDESDHESVRIKYKPHIKYEKQTPKKSIKKTVLPESSRKYERRQSLKKRKSTDTKRFVLPTTSSYQFIDSDEMESEEETIQQSLNKRKSTDTKRFVLPSTSSYQSIDSDEMEADQTIQTSEKDVENEEESEETIQQSENDSENEEESDIEEEGTNSEKTDEEEIFSLESSPNEDEVEISKTTTKKKKEPIKSDYNLRELEGRKWSPWS